MQSRIKSVKRLPDDSTVELEFMGKVTNTTLINAKDIKMTASLSLKTALADQIRVGSVITITLSDEEPEKVD